MRRQEAVEAVAVVRALGLGDGPAPGRAQVHPRVRGVRQPSRVVAVRVGEHGAPDGLPQGALPGVPRGLGAGRPVRAGRRFGAARVGGAETGAGAVPRPGDEFPRRSRSYLVSTWDGPARTSVDAHAELVRMRPAVPSSFTGGDPHGGGPVPVEGS